MLQSDTGSYLTALPCSVCLRHSPAPFPRSTTHTKTHAWSPPPPLLPLLVRGEREAESSEERTLVELYKVRVNTDRWRFHAGFVFSLPFSITYPAILPEAVCSRQSALASPGDDITAPSANQKPGYTWPKRTRLLPSLTSFQQNYFLYQKLLVFHISILVLLQDTLQCNARQALYRWLQLKPLKKIHTWNN